MTGAIDAEWWTNMSLRTRYGRDMYLSSQQSTTGAPSHTETFAAQMPFELSQRTRADARNGDVLPRPPPVWGQHSQHVVRGIGQTNRTNSATSAIYTNATMPDLSSSNFEDDPHHDGADHALLPLNTPHHTSLSAAQETSDFEDDTDDDSADANLPTADADADPEGPDQNTDAERIPSGAAQTPLSSTSFSWERKADLRGTVAHDYRGPLPAEKVLALLKSCISKNGRMALMGDSGGYLTYMHFLGPATVPTARKRKVTNETCKRETWRCRICHEELHAPMDQVSNLGVHLYGTRTRPGRGCLDLRGFNSAEVIPTPARDINGVLIRLGASNEKRRVVKRKAPPSPAAN